MVKFNINGVLSARSNSIIMVATLFREKPHAPVVSHPFGLKSHPDKTGSAIALGDNRSVDRATRMRSESDFLSVRAT